MAARGAPVSNLERSLLKRQARECAAQMQADGARAALAASSASADRTPAGHGGRRGGAALGDVSLSALAHVNYSGCACATGEMGRGMPEAKGWDWMPACLSDGLTEYSVHNTNAQLVNDGLSSRDSCASASDDGALIEVAKSWEGVLSREASTPRSSSSSMGSPNESRTSKAGVASWTGPLLSEAAAVHHPGADATCRGTASHAAAHAKTAAQALAWAAVHAHTEKESRARAEAAEAAAQAAQEEKGELIAAMQEEAMRTRELLQAHARAATQACHQARADAAARTEAEALARSWAERASEAEARARACEEKLADLQSKMELQSVDFHQQLVANERELGWLRDAIGRAENEVALARRVCTELQQDKERTKTNLQRTTAQLAAAQLAFNQASVARVSAEGQVSELEAERSTLLATNSTLNAELAHSMSQIADLVAKAKVRHQSSCFAC